MFSYQGSDSRDRGLVELLASGRRDKLDACAAKRELTLRGAFLLAHETGHAGDHKEEENG